MTIFPRFESIMDNMEKIPILIFRLEGPLQSWGERAKWNYRDTAGFPTKSGICGLFSCALGYERDDERIGIMCSSLQIAVRADRAGEELCDFHTIQADCLLSAEGKKRAGGNTVISQRYYLQDASFFVCVRGNEELLEKIACALKKPRWTLYLGRKSCVPTVPPIGRISKEYGSLLEAIYREPLSERHDESVYAEVDSLSGEGYDRPDIRDISSDRDFKVRRVKLIKAGEKGEILCS